MAREKDAARREMPATSGAFGRAVGLVLGLALVVVLISLIGGRTSGADAVANPSRAPEPDENAEGSAPARPIEQDDSTLLPHAEARRGLLARLSTPVGVAVDAVLVAAVVLTVFVAYGLINNPWYHVLVVEGGSMYPTITAGDLIVIARPPAQIEPGMILTLEVDNSVVTHRVERVNPDGTFVTKGDANAVGDDFSANDVHVVGQVLFRIPALGGLLPVGGAPAAHSSGAWFAVATTVDASAAAQSWSDPTP